MQYLFSYLIDVLGYSEDDLLLYSEDELLDLVPNMEDYYAYSIA